MTNFITAILKFISDMLSERGKTSSMRVMGFIALFFGGMIGLYGTHRAFSVMTSGSELNQCLIGLSILCGVFVGAAVGGKAWQKRTELKNDALAKDGPVEKLKELLEPTKKE